MTELLRTADGEIAISPSALQQIVVHAAESVDGVRVRRPRRALEVQIERDRCRVELQVGALYGTPLGEAAEAVQERVAEALQRMCEVAVDAVDVSIEELDT